MPKIGVYPQVTMHIKKAECQNIVATRLSTIRPVVFRPHLAIGLALNFSICQKKTELDHSLNAMINPGFLVPSRGQQKTLSYAISWGHASTQKCILNLSHSS